MKTVTIQYDKEPECLRKLRENGDTYESLKNSCKEAVRNIIAKDQGGTCAYCEKRLTNHVFLEHFISRSADPSKELNFDNFLGVCSGKTYIDKITGKHIPHCDTSKGEHPLSVDPRELSHIKTLYYESDASLRSNNSQFDSEITSLLNLNFDRLKVMRENEFNRNFRNLREASHKLGLSKKQTIELGLRKLGENLAEYSSYLEHRYSTLLTTTN